MRCPTPFHPRQSHFIFPTMPLHQRLHIFYNTFNDDMSFNIACILPELEYVCCWNIFDIESTR